MAKKAGWCPDPVQRPGYATRLDPQESPVEVTREELQGLFPGVSCPAPPATAIVPIAAGDDETLSDDQDTRYWSHQVAPANQLELDFRHSGWAKLRARVEAALTRWAAPGRVDRFKNCGASAQVFARKDNGELKVMASYCHDRFCLPCANARARKLAGTIAKHIGRDPHRFITLTLKADGQPLADRIKRLLHSFRRLRQTALWKKSTAGGVACLEITAGAGGDSWHPHLHVICHGRYIAKQQLSDAWLRATGDSSIVDITLVRNPELTVQYVAKYASKPFDPDALKTQEQLEEMVIALQGVKMVITFGTWREFVLSEDDEKPDLSAFTLLGSLSNILRQAAQGEPWAVRLRDALLAKREQREAFPESSP